MVSQFGEIWKRIGVNQRISIVLVAVLIIGGLWVFVSIARRPDYEVLFTDVTPRDNDAIVTHLRDSKVPYKVKGSKIYVPSKRKYEVRWELAAKGLPQNEGAGWLEYFPPGRGIGTTETEMDLKVLHALQVELARTIKSLSSIRTAKVHVVLPKETLFSDKEKPTTASVILGLQPGAVLREEQVNAIRFLVSKAVEGLRVGNIAIIDTSGDILASGNGEGSIADLTDTQLKYKNRVEAGLVAKAQAMLASILGPGRSVVRVTADIDFSQMTMEDVKVTKGITTKETISTTNSSEVSTRAGGPTGTDSNTRGSVSANGGSGGNTDSDNESETIDTKHLPSTKTVRTVKSPGEIERLSIAAYIDKKEGDTASVDANFEEIIKGAVGFSEERGDEIVVQEMSFAAVPEPPADEGGGTKGAILSYVLKNLPLAVIIIVLLVFFRQLLKKTKIQGREVPDEFRGRSIGAGIAVGAGGAGAKMSVEEAEELLELPEQQTPAMQKLIWKLADEKPEDLAQMLRAWLKD